MHFGERIRIAREARRLSHDRLAALAMEQSGVKVSRLAIIDWEKERVDDPDRAKLKAVGEVLGLTLLQLLGEEEEPEKPLESAPQLLGFLNRQAEETTRRTMESLQGIVDAEVNKKLERERFIIEQRIRAEYEQVILALKEEFAKQLSDLGLEDVLAERLGPKELAAVREVSADIRRAIVRSRIQSGKPLDLVLPPKAGTETAQDSGPLHSKPGK